LLYLDFFLLRLIRLHFEAYIGCVKKLTFVAVALLLLGASFAQDEDCSIIQATDLVDRSAPKFEDYVVQIPQRELLHSKLDIASNPIAKTYRTVLRNEIKKGPNFAGHYRLAVWGCGSSCAMFAVIDLMSGKVISETEIESVSGARLSADDFLADASSGYWGFRFKKDSRLLVLVGILNEDESQQGAFYFALNHDSLRLIHKTVVKKTCAQ
jgi:hypothetical protein